MNTQVFMELLPRTFYWPLLLLWGTSCLYGNGVTLATHNVKPALVKKTATLSSHSQEISSRNSSIYNSLNHTFKTSSREQNGSDPNKGEFHFPDLPLDYHTSGLLILPHSGIAEPFEAWHAPSKSMSRIDYYYGTDKTFQRGDLGYHGEAFKFVPMFTDKDKNFEGCYSLTGTKFRPITAQTVVPNITWFKYVSTQVYTGTLTTKWQYEYTEYGMKNMQHLWISKTRPYRPIRYEMRGYDMMLGSYYDHYVLEYVSFEKWKPENDILKLSENVTRKCFNWSHSLESSLIVNPMQEFASFSEGSSIDHNNLYVNFKAKNNKTLTDEAGHLKKRHVFKHNLRFINSKNRKNSSFKLAVNHLTDMTPEEYASLQGQPIEPDDKKHKGMVKLETHEKNQTKKNPPKPIEVPDQLDWRDFGAVSPVKGQAICGSCYAFSAAGAAEAAQFLKTGKLVEVSAQQIVDCSWGSGNHGCKGGYYSKALSWIYLHGISTDASYGKYLGQEGTCHFNDTWYGTKIDAFAYVPSYNDTALKYAIARHGPAAVSINVAPLSFQFYSKGIYDDAMCWSNATRHSALVVGYGKENGKEYWLVKNSWSQSWGERGYIKVAMKNNLCGITESPIVALMNHVTFQFPVKEKIKQDELQTNQTAPLPQADKKKSKQQGEEKSSAKKKYNKSSNAIKTKLKSPKHVKKAKEDKASKRTVSDDAMAVRAKKKETKVIVKHNKPHSKPSSKLLTLEPDRLAVALKRTVKDLLKKITKSLIVGKLG